MAVTRIAHLTIVLIIGIYLLVRLRKRELAGVPAYVWFAHIIAFDIAIVLIEFGILKPIDVETLNIWSRGIRLHGVITMSAYAIKLGGAHGKR